jgi:hypothetical protein
MPARGDTGRDALSGDTYRRHRSRNGLPRYYAINAVAEAIDEALDRERRPGCNPRTWRRPNRR